MVNTLAYKSNNFDFKYYNFVHYSKKGKISSQHTQRNTLNIINKNKLVTNFCYS